MIPLLQVIETKLIEVHPRVYFEMAPQGATLPYIVYETVSSDEPEESPESIMLEVEVWSSSSDVVTLEQLAQAVNDKFHRVRYVDANLSAYFHRTDRGPAPNSDPQVRGRQLEFECKVYSMTGG